MFGSKSFDNVNYDDYDDDDDDADELFLWNGWPTKGVYALFPDGTIVIVIDIDLGRIWVQTLLNEAVQ